MLKIEQDISCWKMINLLSEVCMALCEELPTSRTNVCKINVAVWLYHLNNILQIRHYDWMHFEEQKSVLNMILYLLGFSVDLSRRLKSFGNIIIKEKIFYCLNLKGWFHGLGHVQAATLAHLITLFMKQLKASWCLLREIFHWKFCSQLRKCCNRGGVSHWNSFYMSRLPCTTQCHCLWTNWVWVDNLCVCPE